ncbi:hypothetical protein V1527DRAFT_454837 [Lipomyces starkeyi]
MNFWEELVQRATIPIEPDEKLKYNSEELLTSVALTQVYNDMIREVLRRVTAGFYFM